MLNSSIRRITSNQSIKFTIPYPPDRFYKTNKFGSLELTRQGKSYKKQVTQLLDSYYPFDILDELSINIEAYPPDNRNWGISGDIKIALDAIDSSGIVPNDSQYVDLHMRKHENDNNPRIEVTINKIGELTCVTWSE